MGSHLEDKDMIDDGRRRLAPVSPTSTDGQNYRLQCSNEKRKKICVGCVVIALLAISWAGSQQFAQNAVQLSRFDAPYFTTWLGTCWMTLCFPLYILFISIKYAQKDQIIAECRDCGRIFGGPHLNYKQFFTRIVPMNILWLATNYIYLFGLKFIAATDASAIFASNVAFVYMLSLCMLKERTYVIRILACIFCISGVVVFAYSYGFSGGAELLTGALMVIAAAFGAALYKVVFKLWVGEASLGQVSLFLSLLGLSNGLFMWVVFLVLYFAGVEHFEGEDIPWTDLIISHFLGLVFNFTINFGVAYTFPLFISIAMMLGIPLNAAFDVFVKSVTFSPTRLFAAVVVIVGFCTMLLPDRLNEPVHAAFLCKGSRIQSGFSSNKVESDCAEPSRDADFVGDRVHLLTP